VPPRQIIHLDIPFFAAAVERVRDPRLAGRPVIVAPEVPRALVLSLSEEARQAGVRRRMRLTAALKLCPEALVLEPNEALYARAAAAVQEILGRFTPLIEPVGYARVFLDVTGTGRLLGCAVDVADRARREVRERLRLSASVGVAANKLVSRVAADQSVPRDGLLEVPPGDEAPFLAPLLVRRLPGIGPAMGRELEDLNILIVRHLAELSVAHLALAFGPRALLLHERALGIDPTPVRPPEAEAVVVEETRLSADSCEAAPLREAVKGLARSGGRALRRRGERAGRLEVVLRYADDRSASGRRRLATPAASDLALAREAWTLFESVRRRRVRVRGIILRFAALEKGGSRQLELFPEESQARDEALSVALDRLDRRGLAVSLGGP